jgi:LysR family transcriptional regulator, benzoate and cis,cis-muconate-responsive activator of ben and cat genes
MFDRSFLQMQVYIATVAEQGSFSRAAKLLGTSPSFLTRKIGALEKSLGVKLFDRSTRKLALTGAGNLLLPEIEASLRHAERAWDLARFYVRVWKGPLRIGFSPLISSTTLRSLYRLDFSELEASQVGVSLEIPEPRAVLQSATNQKLVDLVLHGELHAGVGITPIEDKNLWVEPLVKEPFCLCVSKNHPFVQRPSLAIRELHGQVLYWIPKTVNPAFYDRVTEYVGSTGAEPVYQEICSITQAIEVVSHGLGLAMLPRSVSRLSHSGVVFRNISDRYLQFETAIFARKDVVKGSLRDLFQLVVSRLQEQRTKLA